MEVLKALHNKIINAYKTRVNIRKKLKGRK